MVYCWFVICFNAVQNNTSLKHILNTEIEYHGFNAVQNNTSLKLSIVTICNLIGFNAVQNNTSLKPASV